MLAEFAAEEMFDKIVDMNEALFHYILAQTLQSILSMPARLYASHTSLDAHHAAPALLYATQAANGSHLHQICRPITIFSGRRHNVLYVIGKAHIKTIIFYILGHNKHD